MSGGPIFPASVYVGGASGNLSPTFYVPSTNSNNAGAIEGIACVASLSSGSTVQAALQFNLPENIPSGQAKLRTLAWANATSGNALFTVNDAVVAVGASLGNSSLTAEAQQTITWSSNDVIVENKVNLSASMTANSILQIRFDYNSTGSWTLAAQSVWQHSVVWE
jgi:hypothetical protein